MCCSLSLQSPLHPIPASPTSPQSVLDGSSSTLSGSASSGVSSLSESNFGPPSSSSCDPPIGPLDPAPISAVDPEDLDYQPIRFSGSESEVLGGNIQQDLQNIHYYHHYIPHLPPLYHLHHEPPALPPKPYLREGCIPEEDTQTPMPRPMPRKISQPIIAATKEEQAKVAWETGVSEE